MQGSVKRALFCFALLATACDVEASLGAEDGGPDVVIAIDAAVHDAGSDGGIDADVHDANDVDAALVDAALVDVGHDASAHDAGSDTGLDATPMCAAPDASACVQCQATTCCTPYAACAMAANCPCIVDCVVVGGHTLAECTVHCGADHGESSPLITCAQGHCACP